MGRTVEFLVPWYPEIMFAVLTLAVLITVGAGVALYPNATRALTDTGRLERLTVGFAAAGNVATVAILATVYAEMWRNGGAILWAGLAGGVLAFVASVKAAKATARRLLGPARGSVVHFVFGIVVAVVAQAATMLVFGVVSTLAATMHGDSLVASLGSNSLMVAAFFFYGLPAVVAAGLVFAFLARRLESTAKA